MKLHYRVIVHDGISQELSPSAEPLVILHGLFGSGDNWQTVARQLGSDSPVLLPDLPNHGESPHTDTFTLEETAEQVAGFLAEMGVTSCVLSGHSLGGKVAMIMALQRPQLARRLCVVDIAPKRYPPRHEAIIEAMREVEAAGVNSRSEADAIMADMISDARIRAFLLKSLVPNDGGGYYWRVNLDLIDRDYDHIVGWPDGLGTYEGETLFIGGGESNYVGAADLNPIHGYFPRARFEEIPGAGHWLHAEKPREFLALFVPFVAGDPTE